MGRRQPLPRLWLMTDERMGDALWAALSRLPRGAGVIVRHYGLPGSERRQLFERVRGVARRRGLVLVLAGSPRQAVAWGADGAHGRSPHVRSSRPLIRTAPLHRAGELHRVRHADAVLVSPVFATRSHPGAAALEPRRVGLLRRMLKEPKPALIALGGMDARRFRRLAALGAYGWAGIDAWIRT
jgi:thiamine-phosphate pyrophosphorylase